jgi:hypothetical protein
MHIFLRAPRIILIPILNRMSGPKMLPTNTNPLPI